MNMRVIKPSVKLILTWGSEEFICAILDVIYRGLTIEEALNKCRCDSELRERRLRLLIERGHYSVLEFAGAIWLIECSRVCTHQLVRHRIASYLQESQRYVNYTKHEIRIIQLPDIDLDAIKYTVEAYRRLVESGVKPEDARYVLPNAVASRILVQMNLREFLINFLPLRTSLRAQHEIRYVAWKMFFELQQYFPTICKLILERLPDLHPDYGCKGRECVEKSIEDAIKAWE